jgi:hypothetical protein
VNAPQAELPGWTTPNPKPALALVHTPDGRFVSKHSDACGKGGPVGTWQQIEPVCLIGPQVPVNAPQAEPGEASVPPTSGHFTVASEALASKHAPPSWQHSVESGAVDVVVELDVLVDVEVLVDELVDVLVVELVEVDVLVDVDVLVVVVGVSEPEIESRQLCTSAWSVGLCPQTPALVIPEVSLVSHLP